MHLSSLFDVSGPRLRALLDGSDDPGAPEKGVALLLDFLPLGREGLLFRAAAARAGIDVVDADRVFPGFPEGVDVLEAARAAGECADVLVVRHPLSGAARAAGDVSAAPVVSAGDGTGEDPLFGLCELAALDERLDGLEGRTVALCGDLKRNRTSHSLAGGLLSLGARVLLVPAKGADPAEGFLDLLERRYGYHPVPYAARSMSSLLHMVDAWVLTPDHDHQLSLFADLVTSSAGERRRVRSEVGRVDAFWIAAPRSVDGEPLPEEVGRTELPWRSADGRAFSSPGKGSEPPSLRASARIRMLRTVLRWALEEGGGGAVPTDAYVAAEGVRCRSPQCIACREPARVPSSFKLLRTDPVLLSCTYCLSRRKVRYVGSRVERKYHPLSSREVRKILPENTVFFETAGEAVAAGFVAAKGAKTR